MQAPAASNRGFSPAFAPAPLFFGGGECWEEHFLDFIDLRHLTYSKKWPRDLCALRLEETRLKQTRRGRGCRRERKNRPGHGGRTVESQHGQRQGWSLLGHTFHLPGSACRNFKTGNRRVCAEKTLSHVPIRPGEPTEEERINPPRSLHGAPGH